MGIEAGDQEQAQARAIIEALRAGIASTPVSVMFSAGQERIVAAFSELLDAQRGAMAVEGGYGQGKTHLLKHLAQLAHRRGYVVSLVPLSKETPFNHWWHVYAAAIRHAVPPDGLQGNPEVLLRSRRWEDDKIRELHALAQASLHPRLAALMEAYYRSDDPESQFLLSGDLLGQPLANSVIARAYRQATGERISLPAVRLQTTGRDYLALMARLFALSGYSGWVLLFDEFELVCRLATLARGRAYANLYAFLRSRPLPGLERVIAVVTVIDQMVSEYLISGKDDLNRLPGHFRARDLGEVADEAERAMRWLVQDKQAIAAPRPDEINDILDRIATLHEEAYGWQRPPGRFYVPELSLAERMRTRVRFCVESLDLTRLYGEVPPIETHETPVDPLHEDEQLYAGSQEVEVVDVDL